MQACFIYYFSYPPLTLLLQRGSHMKTAQRSLASSDRFSLGSRKKIGFCQGKARLFVSDEDRAFLSR